MAISGNKQFNTIIEFLKESKVWPLHNYHALPTSVCVCVCVPLKLIMIHIK